MRRRLLAAFLVGVVLALGYKAWHSDRAYYYLHKSELEAFAADMFIDPGFKRLDMPSKGSDQWFIDNDAVSTNETLIKRSIGSRQPVYELNAYLKRRGIKRTTHDEIYTKLDVLGLHSAWVDPDHQAAEFIRLKGNRMVGYAYSKGGELYMGDPVNYEVIPLDPDWSLKRY